MSTWISLLNDVGVTLYGSLLSASFCQALRSGRNRLIFWSCVVVMLLLQGWIYMVWDAMLLRRIYPLLLHLPLILTLYGLTGKLLWSSISVLTAYLCCQLRRWIALLVVALVEGGPFLQNLVELIITVPLLLLLLRFVSPTVCLLGERSRRLQVQFGLIPALYYIFDYATRVYTDLLSGGAPVVVEFMPFVCCCAYLVFLLYYVIEGQKVERLRQAQKLLDLQLKQSTREISALRESQMLARQYRHDLRHHLQYVSAYIENGQGAQAQAYISGICKEIDAQKVQQYCENEAVNLILSAFAGRAGKAGICMQVQGAIPAQLRIADSDLCVLLSNALENAIHACQSLDPAKTPCTIDVQCYQKGEKLFLQITNPCRADISFDKGLPLSHRPEHGIGVQSIRTIVKRYGGVYSFSVRDGQFILRLSV